MVTFVLPGSDPVTRTPDSALRGETGRERKGEYKGDGKRGGEGDREIRESVRGKREEGGEGNAPPVTPGGTTGDSPPQGCTRTDKADLGGLDGSPVNPWGVSDESGDPAMPGTNTAGEGTTRENDCPTPSGERLSEDLWTRHPLLTALGRGNGVWRPGGEPRAVEYYQPIPMSPFAVEIPDPEAGLVVEAVLGAEAESLSKNTQDAEQNDDGSLTWYGIEVETERAPRAVWGGHMGGSTWSFRRELEDDYDG